MADDQVKYSDLIVDDGAIDALDKRLDDIKRKMAEVKGEAASLTAETRNLSTATREQQQETTKNAAAAENLRQKMKGLTDEQKQLEAERRKYAKLTEQEANRVKTMAGVYKMYADAVREGTDAQMKALPSVDIQNKSYNELYQTYNALKDALNRMTVAERENTTAGKSMVNQAKEIRDTLNNLQQQTGNYALNVGNYMSAMNGLQFQTQQLLREIPSAVNVKQFFLAISNNVPMFTDALTRYNKGIPEIRAKMAGVQAEIAKLNAELATMNTQTAAYEAKMVQINALKKQEVELQKASIGGWRAILKTVGSWQTLVIVGLMLLQKMPEIVKAISNQFTKWFGKAKDLSDQIGLMGKRLGAITEAQKNMASVAAELDVVYRRLQNVEQGTKEWVDGISTINRLTGEHIDALNTTKEKVGEVIDEYKKMQKAIEINRIVASKLGDADVRSQLYYNLMYGPDEYRDKRYDKDFVNRTIRSFVTDEQMNQINDYLEMAHSQLADEREKARKTLDDLYYKYITIPGREQRMWENMYQIVDAGDGKNGPTKTPKEDVFDFNPEDINDQYWKAERARIGIMEDGLKKELELQKLAHAEALEQNDVYYANREEQLMNNLMGELKLLANGNDKVATEMYDAIVRNDTEAIAQMGSGAQALAQQYWRGIEDGERQHNIIEQGLIVENERKVKALWKKSRDDWKKEREENAKDNAKRELKAAVDGWAEYKAKLVEEGKTRKQIVEAEVAAEIARLNLMLKLNRDVNGEIMSDEQKAKVQEWINLLEKLQQTGNYGDYKPGQFMGKGGANVTNERKNYANIWEVLGIDMDSNQTSALNSVFDQAKEALNSWMDARKAAADQAKELADDEVSAAENALNREIELRNQGYANNVALRERELADAKEKQKQAMEEQKKAAQEQILLDAALQTSSLITATANIIKQFPNPLAWGPMLVAMWGSFAYAKIKAYQASTKSITFGEGGSMLLEGGSHQSGHDVNLGIGPDGSNLRAEGGEYFAVINKRNSRKYGSEIPAVVNALNSGMFEDRYIKTSDAVGLLPRIIRADDGSTVDLSAVESGVGELVKQGESRWTVEGEYRVERYKNRVRRVKIS